MTALSPLGLASVAKSFAGKVDSTTPIPAIILDGVGDFRAFTTAPTGAAAGSAWSGYWHGEFQSDGSAMTIREIRNGTGVVMGVRRTATNTIEFKGWQSDASTAVFSNVTAAVPASTGRVLILWSCSGTTAYLYVIKISDGTLTTGTNTPGSAGNIDATGTWYYGRAASGTPEHLDAIVHNEADAAEAIDLSVADNREEFYDSTNFEFRNPGSNGSNPFSAQPLVSFQDNAGNFLVNAGSGGDADTGSNSGDGTSPGTYADDYAASAVAFNYIGFGTDSANATTHTFTDFATGTSASGDKIIVCIASWSSGATLRPATGCTVGGNAATKVNTAGIYDGSLFSTNGDVYVIDAPGDGAQTIVTTHTGGSNGVDIIVLRAFLPGGSTASDTATATNATTTDPLSSTIDKVASGGVLAFSCRSRPAGAARTATFDAAFTEVYDANREQNAAVGVEHVASTSAGVTVDVSYSTNDDARSCTWTAWTV